MAVVKAPVRQQSYLTEYDKLLAEQLRQMSGSIGARDIAAESYGGKFPVGTMTAKILGSVLARASDKRAMNREEQAKESYSRAFEIANAMEKGNNLSTTGMSVSPEGNLEILPTGAERGGVSTFTRPDILQTQEEIDKLNEIRAKERETTYGPIIERPRIPYVGSEFEATTEAPLGIPYAPQNVALTVGEEIPEDKSAISKFLSGALPQKVLPTNAEQALSQALRGADVNELEFRDYMQNRRIQNRALEIAEEERLRNLQPEISERSDVYDPDGNRYQAVKITSGNRTFYSLLDDEGNPTNIPMPSDYTATPPKEIKIENNVKVLDTETGKLTFATDSEINDNPDRYVPAPDKPSQYNLSFTRQLNRLIEQNNLLPENQKKSMVELEAEADKIARKITQENIQPTNIEDDKDYEEFNLPPLDIDAMSAGDFEGYINKASNVISGFFGVEPFSPSAKSTQSNTAILKASNVVLAVPLVKKLSSKGSVYTQEKVKAVLPSPNISNSANAARLRALIPLYKQREIEAQGIVANRGQDYGNKASEALKEARNDLSIIKAVIPNLEQALVNYDSLLIKNTDKNFKDTSTEELLELLLKSENE